MKISFASVPDEKSGEIVSPTLQNNENKVAVSIVYDNNLYDERLKTSWGYACLLRGLEKTVLFDTGGDGKILLDNMKKLDLDPSDVEIIVLSHFHWDHTGGLKEFLKLNNDVDVVMPPSFSGQIKSLADDVKPSNREQYKTLDRKCRSVAGSQDELARELSINSRAAAQLFTTVAALEPARSAR